MASMGFDGHEKQLYNFVENRIVKDNNMVTMLFSGNKSQMDRIKTAFLKSSGDFNVDVEFLKMDRKPLFRYELFVELNDYGDIKSRRRFLRRVKSAHQILSGDINGFKDYL